MKKIYKVLVVILFLVAVGAVNSYGYCVYNQTDVEINVFQSEGNFISAAAFRESISPGERKCCNWKNITCNADGLRWSGVGLDAYYVKYWFFRKYICKRFSIMAGGVLIVKGKDGHYKCIAKGY